MGLARAQRLDRHRRGLLIAYELPSSAAWAIGLLAGVNLLSTGISFIVLALAGKRGTAPAGAVTA